MTRLKRIASLLCGISIIALAFNAFLAPNNFVVEDVTGIALLFNYSWNIRVEVYIALANIFIMTISYFIINRQDFINSIYGAILMPIMVYLTSFLTPYLKVGDVDLLAQAIFAGIVISIGYRLIFNNGFTSGGTDVINKIFSKMFNISFGLSSLAVDGLIVIGGGLVFGLENMAYSIIIFIIILLFANQKLDGIGDNKIFYINTIAPAKVKKYLMEVCRCDITLIDAERKDSRGIKQIIMCVVKTENYYKVKGGVLAIDKNAFITITDSHAAVNKNNKLFAGKKKHRC